MILLALIVPILFAVMLGWLLWNPNAAQPQRAIAVSQEVNDTMEEVKAAIVALDYMPIMPE